MKGKPGVVLGAVVLLAACSDQPDRPAPELTIPVPSQTPTTSPSAIPTPTSTSTATPSVTSSTGTLAPPGLEISGGFLSLRYDCAFATESFQDKWVTEGRRQPDFGVAGPTERYSSDASGGRADLVFGKAFNAGVGSKDPVRVKANLVADGRVTIWVTKPRPAPTLEVDAAVADTLGGLAAMMSNTRTGEDGGCTVKPAHPLPPQYNGTPDDT